MWAWIATRSSPPTATAAATIARLPRRTCASRYHDDVRRVGGRRSTTRTTTSRATNGGRNWDSERRLARARGRRRRRRGDLPEHHPAVLPEGVAACTSRRPPTRATSSCAGPGCRRTTAGSPTSAPTAPGRRAGIAQILLHDVDAAVDEVRWAKDAGLTGGVLLPGAPPGLGPAAAVRARLRADLGGRARSSACRSTTTAAAPSPDYGDYPEAKVMFLLEVTWWAHRALWHLISRRRDGAPSRPAVRVHRAGHGVDPRAAAHARLLPRPHVGARPARRRHEFGGRA